MPPIEEARTTLATFPNVDLFGGAPEPRLRDEVEMYQNAAHDAMMVVISDPWLDKPGCMANLEKLFEGYKDIVPTAFIFLGNYSSRPSSDTADVSKMQVRKERERKEREEKRREEKRREEKREERREKREERREKREERREKREERREKRDERDERDER